VSTFIKGTFVTLSALCTVFCTLRAFTAFCTIFSVIELFFTAFTVRTNISRIVTIITNFAGITEGYTATTYFLTALADFRIRTALIAARTVRPCPFFYDTIYTYAAVITPLCHTVHTHLTMWTKIHI